MIKWSDIAVKERKKVYKKISNGKSLPLKTLMFKNIYKDLDCVLISCGNSTSEFSKEKIVEFCKEKPVFTVKTATLKFAEISDICITNFYATFQFPEEREYLVFSRQEMPLGYKNWVNSDLIERDTFCESFDNEPEILWGSDVTVKHSRSVINTNRWEQNSLDNCPLNRSLGPGIMNDMVVPILVHCGVKKISILGWDGAKIQDDGTIRHFYDLEPAYKPTMNCASSKFDLNNLKADTNECEQQIACRGEEQILNYLSKKNIEIEILTKNSRITDKIKRNYTLYEETT